GVEGQVEELIAQISGAFGPGGLDERRIVIPSLVGARDACRRYDGRDDERRHHHHVPSTVLQHWSLLLDLGSGSRFIVRSGREPYDFGRAISDCWVEPAGTIAAEND